MESENKQISEGLNKISQEYLNFYLESTKEFGPIAILKKMIDKIEKPFGSSKLGKFLFPLRSKQTKDDYKWHKKIERMNDEEYALIHEINEKTNKENLSQQEMGELENKLMDFEEKWKDPCISQYWVYELKFQLPEFVNKSLKEGYLNVPSEDIASFNVNVLNYFIENLVKYSKRYEKQAKDLINKAAEVYRIDNERGRKGRRRVGPMSINTGCTSTASECLGLMRHLGNALGWSEEETYSFVGMTKQEIEENEKEWGKKSKSLYLEF